MKKCLKDFDHKNFNTSQGIKNVRILDTEKKQPGIDELTYLCFSINRHQRTIAIRSPSP